jgi:hypothetical protein
MYTHPIKRYSDCPIDVKTYMNRRQAMVNAAAGAMTVLRNRENQQP